MPDPIDALMAQFQLSDEERKKILWSNALLGLGAGLMSSGRGAGSWLNNAGQGLLMGAQMGNTAVQHAQQGAIDKLKLREYLQNQEDAKAQREQALRDQQAVGQIFAAGPNLANMGPGGPTPENAAKTAPPSHLEKYRQAAAFYASRGNGPMAEKLSQIADKLEETYSTTPQTVRGPDGQLQLVQFGQRGGTKVAPGMTPAEKAHFADTGGAIVPLDPYTGAPVGSSLTKTLSPEGASSREIGLGNLVVARGHLGLATNADKRAAEAAANPKPQFDSTTGQFVYPPSTDNPTGAAVKPEGYQPKPPEHTRRELDSIDAQLGIVSGAKKAAADVPSAFSMKRGAATLAGTTTESVAGRFDSEEERAARAYVYNVVSAVINERAGAAQSVQELARLRAFLPGELDSSKQIQDKLTAFETYLKDKRKAYSGAGTAAPASGGWSATRVN